MRSIEERRMHMRFTTPPMLHRIEIRPRRESGFTLKGHAYNLSEWGAQFELDEEIKPGTEVAAWLHLPSDFDFGPGRGIFASGRIAWCAPPEEPGPVRMAMRIEHFPRPVDRERLERYLRRNTLRTAA